MICTSCGATIEAGARFCPNCGATVAGSGTATPTVGVPPRVGQSAYRGSATAAWSYPAAGPGSAASGAGRVGRNLRPLATLWLVYAGLRAVGGVIGLLVVTAIGTRHYGPLTWMVGSPMPRYLHSEMWMGFAVPALIVSTLIACGLALVTGLALLRVQRWGRIVALITAVLALFKFPIGTALGAYTLWVLAPSRAGVEYQGMAQP